MGKKTFDKYEIRGAYHWEWYESNRYEYRDNVNFVIDQFPNKGSVLDIGGGDGLMSYKAFEKGLAVTCIDTNSRGIRLARQHFEQQIFGDEGALRKVTRRAKLWVDEAALTEPMKRYIAGEARAEVKSIYDMPDTKLFDYAICHEVIEHVPDPEKLLVKLHNLIRSFAIISTPNAGIGPLRQLDLNSWNGDTFRTLITGYSYEFIKENELSLYVKLYT